MNEPRTFTCADDQRLIDMIHGARQRLVFAAPGVTTAVAEALAQRIAAKDAPPQLVVVLDVDPEVCRLGYGTIAGLEQVTLALQARDLRLQTTEGLRVGLVIADEQMLIYSPTPLLMEAGSTAPEKPNAILLQPDPVQALVNACGLGSGNDPELHQEIGADCLDPSKLNKVKIDLARNPPKEFNLARLERVFNYELQFVDFELVNFKLSGKRVSLDAKLLGISDGDLENRLHNTFELFKGARAFEFHVPEFDEHGKPKPDTDRKLDQDTLSDEAKRIRKDFLIPVGGKYGSVILKRKKAEFEKSVARLVSIANLYSEKVRETLRKEIDKVRDKLIADLAPGLVEKPPKEWKDKTIFGRLDAAGVERRLHEEIEYAFDEVHEDFDPKITVIFRDVTYTTIVDDQTFRSALEKYFGAEEFKKLFEVHHVAPEMKSVRQKPLPLNA